MKERKPDSNRIRKVLLRLGEPDAVPFYELFADPEVILAVTGKEVYTKKGFDVENYVDFFFRLAYDYVPVGMNFSYKRLDSLFTEDTAKLTRGKRGFLDDNHGSIENRKDFGKYKWPIVDSSCARWIDQVAAIIPDGMKIIPGTPGGVLETVMWIMGYVPFSYALAEDEQLIFDIFEKVGTTHLKAIKACLESPGFDKIVAVAMGDDMGFKHSTMISPDQMRRYLFPWQQSIVKLIHDYELPVILHSCGNLEAIMDDLIDYVGIDAKHSFEDAIISVKDAKRKYGSRIAVLGGVDINYLCVSGQEQVRSYVRDLIEDCAPGGGYALGTGNSVANYIPLENYLAMLDEGIKYGVYPIGS